MVAIGLVIVASFSVVYLFNEPNRRETAAEDKLDESAMRGVEVFVANCVTCHGPDGKAVGRQGIPLNTEQNQVTGAAWDLREPVIRLTIERGRGPVMPHWAQSEGGPLNDQQITGLVDMIHLGYWDEVYKEAVAAAGGQEPTPPPLPTASGETPEDPDAAAGQELAASLGCTGCHTVDGSDSTGPSWKGLFGEEVTLADGTTVTADEAYIHESILTPAAKVVEGFQPVMPPFEGRITDEQINQIIAYMKTLTE